MFIYGVQYDFIQKSRRNAFYSIFSCRAASLNPPSESVKVPYCNGAKLFVQNTRKLCLHLKNIRIRFFFGYGDISEFSLSVLRKSVNVFKECTTYDIYSIDTNRHCSSIDCITLSRHLTKALNLCPLHPSGAFQRRTG